MKKQYNNRRRPDWDGRFHGPPLQSKTLLDDPGAGSVEFVATYGELAPGAILPLHVHGHTHSDFIISGRAWAQMGKRKVEIEANSATYFPAGVPHGYEVAGEERLCFYSVFPCEKKGQGITTT
ncbi:MAG: cupin domain-containing protein, partial [Desulfobacterales bacterium]|nr:cupin domain-containing protein [Desulfobacterales bacterium]